MNSNFLLNIPLKIENNTIRGKTAILNSTNTWKFETTIKTSGTKYDAV
jgi:hypothetical protein